jgi:hypothetical protein
MQGLITFLYVVAVFALVEIAALKLADFDFYGWVSRVQAGQNRHDM